MVMSVTTSLLTGGVDLNLISGAVHANTLESLQKENRKSSDSKTRRMQRAFADHLRHVGRVYPKGKNKRVVLTIDNAPWHRGPLIDQAAERLKPGGVLLVEISPMIAESVEQLVRENSALALEATIRDLAGHARVVQASRQTPPR